GYGLERFVAGPPCRAGPVRLGKPDLPQIRPLLKGFLAAGLGVATVDDRATCRPPWSAAGSLDPSLPSAADRCWRGVCRPASARECRSCRDARRGGDLRPRGHALRW